MTFEEALERYRRLDTQRQREAITEQQYLDQVAELRLQDAGGRWWTLQPHSGAWMVYDGNAWVLAEKPSTTVSAPARAARPARKFGWGLASVAILVLMCLCIGVGGVVAWNYGDQAIEMLRNMGQPGEDDSSPEGAPLIDLQPRQMLPVTPGGGPASDGKGVSLSATAGSVEAGVAVQMEVSQGSGPMVKALAKDFTLSDFYQVTAAGTNDGATPAELRFTADNPGARVAAVIDNHYLAVLDVPPSGGQIVLQADINPQTPGSEQVESMGPGGSIAYVLLTPLGATGSQTAPGSGVLMAPAGEVDPRRCTPDVSHRAEIISYCRQSLAKNIQLMYSAHSGMTDQTADMLVDYIETIMLEYQRLGFTNANLMPDRPLRVVVEPGNDDPVYKPGNHTVYIPKDTAMGITTPKQTHALQHELAHFIQHRAYWMIKNYWGSIVAAGSGRWWMEVSADNMAFLLDPTYMGDQLVDYGAPAPALQKTAHQYAPLQWNDELYIHAHLVKVFMCDDTSVCPVSQKTFIEAINGGTYPYDEAAVAKVSANLDEYARYLLSSAPQKGNTAVPLPDARRDYMERVDGKIGASEIDYDFEKNGFSPQLTRAEKDGQKTLKVDASVEKGAVYPLTIANNGAKSGGKPSTPLMITIEPGLPFYYRLDNDAPVFNDGSKKTMLGPIHRDMGKANVRIVAMAKDAAGSFKAEITPLDLRGDWVFWPENFTADSSFNCTNTDPESLKLDRDGTAQISVILHDLSATVGTFNYDPTDHNLLNLDVPPGARLPGGDSEDEALVVEYIGNAMVSSKEITAQIKATLPKRSDESRLPGAALAGVLLPGGLALGSRPGRRWRAVFIGVVILGLLLSLSGCVGFEIYGASGGNYTFQKIASNEDKTIGQLSTMKYWTDAVPTWVLSDGKGHLDVDLTVKVSTSIMGEEKEDEAHCTGGIDFKVTGFIVPDGKITTMPDFNDEE